MTSSGGSRTAPRSRPSATRPQLPGRTPRTWTSCSPNWTRKSTGPGCAARWHPTRPAAAPVHPAAARRPAAARAARSTRGRSARPTPTPDGKTFRPSLFLTLTCPSYGRVTGDGTPADPDSYDYTAAARDALHFAALFDRFIQNLRRYCGYDLQYFAAIEPQRRLAPHVHMAIRGTVSRRELREVIAATYHQVWWPSTRTVRFDGDRLPVWDEANATYLDPETGEVLPTWDQALDAIGDTGRAAARRPVRRQVRRPGRAGRIEGRQPVHRLPDQVPDQAARRLPRARHRRPAGARRPARRGAALGTLLTDLRELAPLRHPAQERQEGPAARGVQGQGAPPRIPRLRRAARADLPQMVRQDPRRPPRRPESLADRDARSSGNRPGTGTPGNSSSPATGTTCPTGQRLLHVVADRMRWLQALDQARRRAEGMPPDDLSATGRAA